MNEFEERVRGSDMMQKKAREPKYSSAVHRSPSLRKLLLVSQLRKREARDRSLLQEHQVWVSMYCWLEREGCLECGEHDWTKSDYVRLERGCRSDFRCPPALTQLFVSHQYNKMATWSSPDHPEHPLDRPPNQAADTEWETMFLQTILKWDVQQEPHYNILTAEKYGSLLQEVKTRTTWTAKGREVRAPVSYQINTRNKTINELEKNKSSILLSGRYRPPGGGGKIWGGGEEEGGGRGAAVRSRSQKFERLFDDLYTTRAAAGRVSGRRIRVWLPHATLAQSDPTPYDYKSKSSERPGVRGSAGDSFELFRGGPAVEQTGQTLSITVVQGRTATVLEWLSEASGNTGVAQRVASRLSHVSHILGVRGVLWQGKQPSFVPPVCYTLCCQDTLLYFHLPITGVSLFPS
ncbi:hypothetical protein O3P69_014151 [Scylla paramamosain]|uniref:Uncharacterized protein n=1 Tax=Scylla paramamosain TaxID=85552 RepID=A0AAW0SFI1_SCYPA